MTIENQNTQSKPAAQALTTPSGSGAALIAAERQRQMDVEGWTPEHDDEHSQAEMAKAAGDYLHEGFIRAKYGRRPFGTEPPHRWPWDAKWWKPSEDPIPNLVKAGALIAAEIDRLQRLQNNQEETPTMSKANQNIPERRGGLIGCLARLVLALHWCWVYIVVQAIHIPFFLMEELGSKVTFWTQGQLFKFKRHKKHFENNKSTNAEGNGK